MLRKMHPLHGGFDLVVHLKTGVITVGKCSIQKHMLMKVLIITTVHHFKATLQAVAATQEVNTGENQV